jgi:hypothetical protein
VTRTPVADEIERSIPPENLTPGFRQGLEIAVRIARAFELAAPPAEAPRAAPPATEAPVCPACDDWREYARNNRPAPNLMLQHTCHGSGKGG